MTRNQLIWAKFKDLVLETNDDLKDNPTKILGTLIMVLSGLVLYLDKALLFFNIEFFIPQKFIEANMDFQTFIWLMASCVVSPILFFIAFYLKPYKASLAVPIYCYSLQGYFILIDYKLIDRDYLVWYALGTTAIIISLVYFIKKLTRYYIISKIQKTKERLENGISKN